MNPLRFSIGDIPVRVDFTFWLIMAIIGFSPVRGSNLVVLFTWIAIAFLGVLAHEMGHAVMFRTFGLRPTVVLYAMGGVTSAAGTMRPFPRLITTVAGPAVGLLLGGAGLVAAKTGLWPVGSWADRSFLDLFLVSLTGQYDESLTRQIFAQFIFINIGWSILNLIPLRPLDGGQALESILELFRVPFATKITAGFGLFLAALGGWWAFRAGQLYLLMIMAFLGYANIQSLLSSERSSAAPSAAQSSTQRPGVSGSPPPPVALAAVNSALSQGRVDDAIEMARQEHRLRPSPESLRLVAIVLTRTRRYDELAEALTDPQADEVPDVLAVAASALLGDGRLESALALAQRAWTHGPDDVWQPAVTAAAAESGMGDVEAAFRWLRAARQRGWDDPARVRSDPLFADLRGDPRAAEFY